MSIVFGWYSFIIKSFTPKDLNIEGEDHGNISFEVRQKCFHLFWIPFFGLGKIYGLRKNGELFQLPEDVIAKIKSLKRIRTPWYTFSLPILLLAGYIGYQIDEKYSQYKGYVYNKEKFEVNLASIEKEISRLSPDHYIKIKEADDWYSQGNCYLKVNGISDSSIRFTVINMHIPYYEVYPYLVKKHYQANFDTMRTVTISYANLKKAVCKDFDIYSEHKVNGETLLSGDKKYVIEKIDFIKGPSIKATSTGGYYNKNFTLSFVNDGEPAELLEINNLEGSIQWSNKLPMMVNPRESSFSYLNLNAENSDFSSSYKFELVFRDSLDNKYKYLVEGFKFDNKVSRID
jgi:hypothetical protein